MHTAVGSMATRRQPAVRLAINPGHRNPGVADRVGPFQLGGERSEEVVVPNEAPHLWPPLK
jgi:hypothetical protein